MKQSIKIVLLALLLAPALSFSQAAYQSAFRAYSDYMNSVQEKSPDLDYLNKAKEKIDLVVTGEDKDKAKVQTLYCKIYYAVFQYNLDQEKKKLASTVTNATEAAEIAYGNVSIKEFEIAGQAMEKVAKLEEGQSEKPYSMELGMAVGISMLNDVQNLAIGRFKVKKYDEAMDLFQSTYEIYKGMGKKDTNAIFNAMLSAELAKNNAKVLEYGKIMIDDKVASANTYNKIHFAQLAQKDTASAESTLKNGLTAFPNDKGLILNYINLSLMTKKETQAMEYINKAIEKDPTNCALYLVQGNIFNDQANPKADGKDAPKPANFEELIKKAETYYKKTVECDPKGYDGNFNLGAVYNNWGNWFSDQSNPGNAKIMDAKAKEMWQKAIQYLEAALVAKPCDKTVMFNLARLYRFTEQTEKAAAMTKKMKEPC